MDRIDSVQWDFEAVIRITCEADGGRKTPPFNGVRWDFSYAEDDVFNQVYMIWPDFLSPSGRSLPTDAPLPVGVDIPARMKILDDQLREKIHRARISPGVTFYCHEGSRRVAFGRVTRITGLAAAGSTPSQVEVGH